MHWNKQLRQERATGASGFYGSEPSRIRNNLLNRLFLRKKLLINKDDASLRPVKAKWTVAIVGNLQAFNVLLPAFQAVPCFEVVALCGRNRAVSEATAAKNQIPKSIVNWERLLNDREIEVAALALPAFVQSKAAIKLAAAGKHLFCEKPLAADLAGAQAVCDTVAVHQRTAVVNFGFRMVEAFRDFRSIIQSGVLGAPQFVMVEWLLSTRRDSTLTWNWKSDARQGGGTLNLMASHILDYLSSFFGEIADVRLQTATLVPFRPDAKSGLPRLVKADDTCNLWMTLPANIPASVTVSTTLSVSQNHRIRVWSEKGMLELANAPGDDYYDGFKLSFQPAKNVNSDFIAKVKRHAPLSKMEACFPGRITVARRVVEEFARALSHRRNIAPTLEDALKVQECMEMARRKTP